MRDARPTSEDRPRPAGRGDVFVRARALRVVHGDGASRVVALDSVDLDVARGESVALLGASGSGKSTLLHLLGALEKPTEGRVSVAGIDLAGLGDRDAARYRRCEVGFVFQRFNLVPTLSALDNVALPARLAGRATREARESAGALLERVGLGERLDAAPAELSGGEQQRVALARALIASPPLVLADEPTGNLDRATGDTVVDLLEELVAERGTTLILATHARELAGRLSRRVTLADGRRVDDESAVAPGNAAP